MSTKTKSPITATIQVDVGVSLPPGTDLDNVTFNLNYASIQVQTTDGKPIEGAFVIGHTTIGPVDSFTDEDVTLATDEEIEKWLTEGGR
jgi:hypothetical protein